MNVRCLYRGWASLAVAILLVIPASSSAQNAAAPGRKIQANDILVISVLGEPEMNKETKVSNDGRVDYFYVGDVQVAGQTVAEAQEKIRQLLMKDYFVNPQVGIQVKQYAQETVTVLGQVNRPGPVLLPTDRRVDIVEVIGMAGDFNRVAKKSAIELRRKGKSVKFSYDDLRKITDPAKKVYVEPDDVVEVDITIF
ncbi:MAG: polysaccharide biosynthesis/export family protein [Verrucomicrobiales bacterium]|nr:polysaccharide biosynthesis/export family protein [Verrucomicrobiales bacterium]